MRGLAQFSAKWIRFAVKNCGTRKKRADSTEVEAALGTIQEPFTLNGQA
jgi:hypothetical protein